jgi:hypothetical protein
VLPSSGSLGISFSPAVPGRRFLSEIPFLLFYLKISTRNATA